VRRSALPHRGPARAPENTRGTEEEKAKKQFFFLFLFSHFFGCEPDLTAQRLDTLRCPIFKRSKNTPGQGEKKVKKMSESALKVVLNISDRAGLMWCEQNMVNVSAR
jgi:hypothetical protein